MAGSLFSKLDRTSLAHANYSSAHQSNQGEKSTITAAIFTCDLYKPGFRQDVCLWDVMTRV